VVVDGGGDEISNNDDDGDFTLSFNSLSFFPLILLLLPLEGDSLFIPICGIAAVEEPVLCKSTEEEEDTESQQCENKLCNLFCENYYLQIGLLVLMLNAAFLPSILLIKYL